MNNKDKYIQKMFSSIASRYDLLNRLLSCGIDIYWRRSAVKMLPIHEDPVFLDIATGTCDVALEIMRKNTRNARVVGIDFSLPMLKIGSDKVKNKMLDNNISLQYADAQYLPFMDNSFDGTIIAFGLRNIVDKRLGISEMRRVVKNGGKVIILEFTTPGAGIFKGIYYLYFKRLLPFIGGIISGKREAYQYLPESVIEFSARDMLKELMEEIGLREVKYKVLTFGIAAIHVGIKS